MGAMMAPILTNLRRPGRLRRAAAALVLAVVASARAASSQTDLPPAPPGATTYTIFLRGIPIGTEQVAVDRTPDGWTITSSGRTGAPVSLIARQVQLRYTADWKPVDLVIDATLQGEAFTDRTTVTGTTAATTFTQGGQSGQRSHTVAADTVLLPSPFWGPFEALAQRLASAPAGATLSVYNLQGSVPVTVGAASDETIDLGRRAVHGRRTAISVAIEGAAALAMEIWGDDTGHLMRVSIPAQGLEIVREDIASVSARRVVSTHPGDESVRIPSEGFSLAGTLSKPQGTAAGAKLPAVILVSGTGLTDRDETAYGVPIFGQLAGTLADAGFVVVRYDKRGVGQSGGRADSAQLVDYAEDVRAATRFLGDRKDVDKKRIGVLGYGDGALVAMLATAKFDRVGAVILVNAPGTTGVEANLAQVARGLARSNRTAADKAATIELQKKIQQAVLTGTGWEGISPALRKQADVPGFQSFLAFDPAKPIGDMSQPMLVVQGQLDTETTPDNADRLEALATARKKNRTVDMLRVPGVNHLLLPAKTGEADEYPMLTEHTLSPAVTSGITAWLQKIFVTRGAAPR